MEKGYNLLTQKLLAEGYTADEHPDYVYVGTSCRDKDDPLRNHDGGFEYYGWYVYGKTFKTPCGLQCKGSSCMAGPYRGDIKFSFENDMATVKCPYNDKECVKKHSSLRDAGVGIISSRCNVHMTDEEYCYEGSVEGILKLEDDRMQREKISFNLMHQGRTCDRHMFYDEESKTWQMRYNPCECARLECTGNFGKTFDGGQNVCPILGRPLDKKKGNVFYDIKVTSQRRELDGTLFEGQVSTQIEKGVRFLRHAVSMDICRNIVKLCRDRIESYVRLSRYHTELFFAEYYGRVFTVEIMNIRAESRESRDLMQDLQDIRDGIQIFHASDAEKRKKEYKKEKRKKAKEKRIDAIEKKILDIGFGNLEWIDQNRAYKLLDIDRIDELEAIREENLKKEQEKPMQLSIFDMM